MLGQAKWVPGQIAFQTTRTGRLPSVQPLIEAGLPYAPYIEHGSYAYGTPDIARYGRDPYRGLGEDQDVGMLHAMSIAKAMKKQWPDRPVFIRAPKRTPMNQMTTGDAIRRLENQPYDVANSRTKKKARARNMRVAMKLGKAMARRSPGTPIHIHLPNQPLSRQSLVAVIMHTSRGTSVRFNQALRGLGGGTLTDWACDSQEFAKSWAERVNAGLTVGTQAAVLSAGIAGLIGSVLKRPLLGTAVGAAVGFGTYAIWTAPQRVNPST